MIEIDLGSVERAVSQLFLDYPHLEPAFCKIASSSVAKHMRVYATMDITVVPDMLAQISHIGGLYLSSARSV